MRAQLVKEAIGFERSGNPHRSLSIGLRENSHAFFLALLPGLVEILNGPDLKFIEFEQIPITDLNDLHIKYQSSISSSKYMAARIWLNRSEKTDYTISFDIGRYVGGTSFAYWNPTYNIEEDVRDLVDAMSLWSWWQLSNSLQKTNQKPSSAIWDSQKK